ncbi:hypothetical protein PoB_003577700 [Plakobranchus ocellatus]|uniref:Uncharacterized protein n=1 Tax=Plakobranchus ocellatus TaxID=259542 RepID=A0AAV4AQR3_9GAST|nr:hypothetical protein PoB_003577700 [Plakobranchus ocellatus]
MCVISPPPTVSVPDLKEIAKILPLLTLKDSALTPKLWISRKRQPVPLVITLSTSKSIKYKDNDDQLLFSTLDSLFFALPPPDQHKCLVMVFITEVR